MVVSMGSVHENIVFASGGHYLKWQNDMINVKNFKHIKSMTCHRIMSIQLRRWYRFLSVLVDRVW